MKRLVLLLIVLLAACERNSPLELAQPRHDVLDDVTPPSVLAFTVTPTSVDASAAAVMLTFQVQFTDDLSGIDFCSFTFRSPSGDQWTGTTFSGPPLSGTPLAGVMEAQVSLPRYAESGTWTMQYLYCRDLTTNGVQYGANNPLPGGAPVFTVTSVGDTEPPQVTTLSIDPAVIDASQGPAAISIRVAFTDNLAGLTYCSAVFYSATRQQWVSFYAADLASGNWNDGELQTQMTLPRFSESGVWTMEYLYCRDNAGNGVQYDLNNPLPVWPRFEVVSAADVTPPTITSFTITPSSVDVSAGPADMKLRIVFTDAMSGIDFCGAVWRSPTAQQWISFTATTYNHLVSGNVNDGVFEVSTTLPQYSEAGEWRIQYLYCRDAARNGVQFTVNEPPPFPLPTFTVEETNACILIGKLIAATTEQSLLAKARAALASCERGQKNAAANQIRAYANELDAMLKTGRIDAALAAQLSARVTRILELLTR